MARSKQRTTSAVPSQRKSVAGSQMSTTRVYYPKGHPLFTGSRPQTASNRGLITAGSQRQRFNEDITQVKPALGGGGHMR